MTIKSSVTAFLFCALIPALGYAETTWRFEPLGVQCVFPAHWVLEQAAEHGDLAKGGVLVRADRTPGLPAGVRFELSLEPLSIKRTGPTEALEVLLKNLKSTPKLQVLDSEKSEISRQCERSSSHMENRSKSSHARINLSYPRYERPTPGRIDLRTGRTCRRGAW